MAKTSTKPPSVKWDDFKLDYFKGDKKAAIAYLKVSLKDYLDDRDSKAFVESLRVITEAFGGVGTLAKKTKLNRQTLYKALSPKGNPQLDTVGIILGGLGLRLSVEAAGK